MSVSISPGTDIQPVVNANPAGTAYILTAGTHTLQGVIPKSGDSFTNSGVAILEGGRLLTGWTASGGNYYVTGQTQGGAHLTSGSCLTGYSQCLYPDQLWLAGVLQTPVSSLAALGTGKWFYDYGADRVYLPANPGASDVLISVIENAFSGSATNVTLTGLIIQHYRPTGQGSGAIQCGTGWTLSGITCRNNAMSGARLAAGCTVTGGRMTENGVYGLTGGGGSPGTHVTGMVVDGVELDHNNTQRVNPGFGAGAAKFTRTLSMEFRNCNAHDNNGNGPWWDVDNDSPLVEDNLSANNTHQGFFLEKCYGALGAGFIVRRNTASGNGYGRSNALGYGAGILISVSSNGEVTQNDVADNHNGICVVQQSRGSGDQGPYLVHDVAVHENFVTPGAFFSGLLDGTNTPAVFTSRNITFDDNVWCLTSPSDKAFRWAGASLDFAGWQAAGLDAGGSLSCTPPGWDTGYPTPPDPVIPPPPAMSPCL